MKLYSMEILWVLIAMESLVLFRILPSAYTDKSKGFTTPYCVTLWRSLNICSIHMILETKLDHFIKTVSLQLPSLIGFLYLNTYSSINTHLVFKVLSNLFKVQTDRLVVLYTHSVDLRGFQSFFVLEMLSPARNPLLRARNSVRLI